MFQKGMSSSLKIYKKSVRDLIHLLHRLYKRDIFLQKAFDQCSFLARFVGTCLRLSSISKIDFKLLALQLVCKHSEKGPMGVFPYTLRVRFYLNN